MAIIAPTSTQLSEPWRASLRGRYTEGRRGTSASTSMSTKPRKPKGFQEKPEPLSLSSSNFSEDPTSMEKLMFEEGIFETGSFSEGTDEGGQGSLEIVQGKPKDTKARKPLQKGGLVPEEWKYMQQDLQMTKKEKKKQFLITQRENTQLNELRDDLRRQRIDLLSETEESAHAQSLAGRTQLLTPSQLVELERDLSTKAPDPRFLDKEFDEMFTFHEKGFLKRTIPDFSQVYCGKWPLLHMLASSGQYFFLDQFLNLGVEVDEEDEDGYTPLQRAVQARRETAVTQLLRAGANVDVLDGDGANLLHLSVLVHSLHLVKLFVIRGVQVNHADKYGWTPLHVAVLTGRDDIVRHLGLSGAKQSIRNEDGMTPMDIAIALGKGLNSTGVARTLRRVFDLDLTD
ncbi:hypothetical protein GOP47_0024464 [Adiantum capillus-veneris]|uniref:Uncharacterized protein n=1 Tax=Adiantum capillus-veneris TaxID=13818 RepID=A0A9D4U444_ADICA|nr:hypothetical protein GOP47_0024464 [Adiantum capillus-veneris]